MKKNTFALALFIAVIGVYWIMLNKSPLSNVDNPHTVKIGVIYPLSGDGANFGAAAKITANIFMDDLQKHNPHYNYHLIWEDNQFKLPQTATVAQKLINIDKVDALITMTSNHGQVVSPIVEKNKVLHLSIATDPSVAAGKYNFAVATSAERESQKLISELLRRKIKNVSAVVIKAQGPDMIYNTFKTRSDESGITIGQEFKVNTGERDFRMVVSKIIENSPDMILLMLMTPESDIFLRQLRQSGSKIPVTGIETFSFLKNKDLAEGMFFVDAAKPTEEFIEKFQAKTGSDNTEYGEYLYTVLQILVNAYEKVDFGSNKPDNEAIAAKIYSASNGMQTAIGPITINKEGFIDSNAVIKKIKNGKIVLE